ncbi:hypothetical protein PsorP6_014099 [Peronosclerospora sorghi]|uniref:Uncharacterized protein n=1 Tax=Peronosclerospora sorghi TaxID=230839 RepID=A0ACC0VIQ9_9STRA|nr:hypothetical protein PsorP6_014099 [Peronosclerospora sorghi]
MRLYPIALLLMLLLPEYGPKASDESTTAVVLVLARDEGLGTTTRRLRSSVGGLQEEAMPLLENIVAAPSASVRPSVVSHGWQWVNNKVQTWLLPKDEKKLFTDAHVREFEVWVHNTRKLAKPDNTVPVIKELTEKYDDERLYKTLEEARDGSRSPDLAKKLYTELIQYWLFQKKDPQKVWHLFQTETEWKKDPKLFEWIEYVASITRNDPDKSMISVVKATVQCKEVDLARLALNAQQVEETKVIATTLEEELFQFWIDTGVDPYDALHRLELDVYNFASNPLLVTLTKFVNKFNAENPRNKVATIHVLTKKFGVTKVALELRRTITDPPRGWFEQLFRTLEKKVEFNKIKAETIKTEKAAKKAAEALEQAQRDWWLSNGYTIDGVSDELGQLLTSLERDARGYTLNPSKIQLLETWVAYLDFYLERFPGKREETFSYLKKFSDRVLIQILEKAKSFPNLDDDASELLTATCKRIFSSGKQPPDEVFRLLGLGDDEMNVLSHPLFHAWREYVTQYNDKNPDKTVASWYAVLDQMFNTWTIRSMIDHAMDDEKTKTVAEEVEQMWLAHEAVKGRDPTSVFGEMRLDRNLDTLFVNPRFRKWLAYLNAFNANHPDKEKSLLECLVYYLAEEKVVQQLLKLMDTSAHAETWVTDLTKSLIDRWKTLRPNFFNLLVPNAQKLKERYDAQGRLNSITES